MIKSKLIEINKTFSFECDSKQWILHEYKAGMSKDKVPIIADKRTYHGTLLQVCHAVINKRCNDCNDVNAIIHSIEQSNVDLIKAINSMSQVKQ